MERRSVVAAESRCPSHPTRGRLERACNGPNFGVSKSGLTAMGLSKSQLMAARDLERGAPIGTDERVDCVLNMVLSKKIDALQKSGLTRCRNPDLHGAIGQNPDLREGQNPDLHEAKSQLTAQRLQGARGKVSTYRRRLPYPCDSQGRATALAAAEAGLSSCSTRVSS